jgi:hypothetical protein
MANGPNPSALRFSKTLRGHLDSQGGTVHGLARKIADKRYTGHAPRKMVEQARRDLNRYLSGRFNPGADKRREIAVALGLEANALDEEEHLPWQILYPAADLETVLWLRALGKKSLRTAAEIEKALQWPSTVTATSSVRVSDVQADGSATGAAQKCGS